MRFKNKSRIHVFLKDKNRKNVFVIIKEVLILLVSKREIPFYYFKHLYKKDTTNIFDYLGTKEGARIHKNTKLHRLEHTMIMNNKLCFALYAEKNSLKTPKLYGHNLNNQYFLNGKMETIENKEGLRQYFELLFESNGENSLFIKPLSEYGGKGCFKLRSENLMQQLDTHEESLLSKDHIFSKVVQQHPEINNIHSNSLNTLRLVTFITDDDTIEIVSAFMRFGIGKGVVDNGSSGGLYVGINVKESILNDIGYQTMEYGGKKLTHHPGSNFKLGGFKIPYYKEACKLVITSVEHLPDRWIGWDVAITPKGPIIIEANDCPDLHMSDVANNGLLQNKYIKSLVSKLNTNSY